ncbi:hypothetical protein HYH02_011138 [Chlamydomonas schloesseri]|uniref:Uncharacterized protein n=1 Tax=Chlamydomonas schloesseri TaxID=2026947 RepID=A0A835T684_9CHLO|nr:hypothetical protein HYH02_011138 [Chlamydomonas schloesseri]|eukprot:KAG2437762.1 hypothetical protein HYH02_011138 [Chlamydomonas schloesseri]
MQSLAARSLRGIAHGASRINGTRHVPLALRSLASQARTSEADASVSAASKWLARGAAVVAAAGGASAAVAASTDNPFDGAEDVPLLTTSGVTVKTGDVAQGRFCWEQAQALLRARPQFEAAGYKLVVISIGTPEGGRQFCSTLPFPPELLLLDPDYKLYGHLKCYEGFKAMFSPKTWDAMKAREWNEFKALLDKYKMIAPKSVDSTAVMGGLFVLDNGKVLYEHRDDGPGVHAPMKEVLASCCTA